MRNTTIDWAITDVPPFAPDPAVLAPHRAHLLWLLAYAAIMTTVVAMMLAARGCAIQQYGTARALDQWQQWREVAKQQSRGGGPVKRRERTMTEPPALVLMREHFPVALALALVTSSALFFTIMFTLRGAFGSAASSSPPSAATTNLRSRASTSTTAPIEQREAKGGRNE